MNQLGAVRLGMADRIQNPLDDNELQERAQNETNARDWRAINIFAGGANRRRTDVPNEAVVDRRMSCRAQTCCWLFLILAVCGSIAFVVPAGIYSVRLITSNRQPEVAAYNAAVTAWVNGGQDAFAALNSEFIFTIAAADGSAPATNLSLVTGSPSTVGSGPALAPDGDLTSYAATSAFSASAAQVAAPITSIVAGTPVVPGNVTLTLAQRGGSAGNPSSVTLQVPLVYHSIVAANCAGTVTGDGCTCASPYAFNSGTRKCENWLQLTGLCLVAQADASSGQLQLAVDTAAGAGCAVAPSAGGPPPSFFVPIPQLDACVPASLNHVSPYRYAFLGGQPNPSLSLPLTFDVDVTVRGVGDPYVTALAQTQAAQDSSGRITFGTSLGTLGDMAAGFWAAFAVCFSMLLLYLTCVCSTVFDRPLHRLYANNAVGSPQREVSGYCGAVVAKSRASKLCSGGSGVTCLSVGGMLALLTIYSWLAFVLLDAPYVCAYKTVSCGDVDVQLQCGTLKDLQQSSSTGAAFRGLSIAAIALALIPIGCFMCLGSGTVLTGGAAAALFVVPLAAMAILDPISGILQIAAAGLWASSKGAMATAYCTYISTELLQPDYCASVAKTDASLTAQTVLGVVAVLLGCALAAGRVMRRRT
jgi:hypothetical protein